MKVESHPEAEEEMIESARFYEQRSESSSSRLQAPSKGLAFAGGWSPVSPSRFFTKNSEIGSSLGPSCISTDGPAIGRSVSVIEQPAAFGKAQTDRLLFRAVEAPL